jgi:Rrf2 family nitric oxide-sensitive transcriptional repressor
MQLTHFTDYSLRVLMFLGLHPGRLVTITEIARAFDISHNHLRKVVNYLAVEGLIKSVRGKTGGITLAKEPTSIRIGDVVRLTEAHFNLVECFDANARHCCIAPVCALRRLLRDGLEQFFAVLNQRTLADLLQSRESYIAVLPSQPVRKRPPPEQRDS